MSDLSNLKKIPRLAAGAPAAMTGFQEMHKAAVAAGATEQELAEATFVAVALRAGAALTHGTHLMADAA